MEDNPSGRVLKIIDALFAEYPDSKTELDHTTPLEMLVATILSAQCTDRRVNLVTKDLFKKYLSAVDYAKADLNELEEEIKSTGFYRSKARNIKAAAKLLVERYDSKVPRTMDEMLTLPGVARKTANVVLGASYGVSEGIAVDTHVKRLAYRLGLTKEEDPVKIERDLMKIVPKKHWIRFSFTLVLHGRRVCAAKKPMCGACKLNAVCPSAFKVKNAS